MESSVPDVIVPSCEPFSEIAIPNPFDEFLLSNDECADVPRPKRRRQQPVGAHVCCKTGEFAQILAN